MQGLLKREDLKGLMIETAKSRTVYVPVRDAKGVFLSEFSSDDDIVLNYANVQLPPKRYYFPQCEVILSYQGQTVTAVPLPENETVLFGVRPCDAAALQHLDRVFLDPEFVDPHYQRRRESSLIVALACNDPGETCFCTSFGGGPSSGEGSDVLVYQLGDSLLLEACSDRGGAFMESYKQFFRKPNKGDIDARDRQIDEVTGKVSKIDTAGLPEKLRDCFDSPLWDQLAQRCVGCGVCTYLCPTCHCFGFHDETSRQGGRRLRIQDSCIFPGFTLEASGHNPRSSGGQRMRQRVMHKMRYAFESYGEIFCVGCGRCVEGCPVNVDVRETIAEVIK